MALAPRRVMALWAKTWTQHGTLVNGNKDKSVRSHGFILTHAHIQKRHLGNMAKISIQKDCTTSSQIQSLKSWPCACSDNCTCHGARKDTFQVQSGEGTGRPLDGTYLGALENQKHHLVPSRQRQRSRFFLRSIEIGLQFQAHPLCYPAWLPQPPPKQKCIPRIYLSVSG